MVTTYHLNDCKSCLLSTYGIRKFLSINSSDFIQHAGLTSLYGRAVLNNNYCLGEDARDGGVR
jgi:hypothetical protein